MMFSFYGVACEVKVNYKDVKLNENQIFAFFSKNEAETFCKNVEKLYYVESAEIIKDFTSSETF